MLSSLIPLAKVRQGFPQTTMPADTLRVPRANEPTASDPDRSLSLKAVLESLIDGNRLAIETGDFFVGVPADDLFAGFLEIEERSVGHIRPAPVVGEQWIVRSQIVGVTLLVPLRHASVKLAPLGKRQKAVGHILSDGMFERVCDAALRGRPTDQVTIDQGIKVTREAAASTSMGYAACRASRSKVAPTSWRP